jgi:hypothetical protein
MTATTAAKIDFDDVQYLTKLKDTPNTTLLIPEGT